VSFFPVRYGMASSELPASSYSPGQEIFFAVGLESKESKFSRDWRARIRSELGWPLWIVRVPCLDLINRPLEFLKMSMFD